MAHTGKVAPVDTKTFTLELAERFGPVLDALGKPSSNVPFIMPARIASTPADEQIKEGFCLPTSARQPPWAGMADRNQARRLQGDRPQGRQAGSAV
jgi:peptide/nickel transport system substrate-binding protein